MFSETRRTTRMPWLMAWLVVPLLATATGAAAADRDVDSFEDAQPGPFQKLTTPLGDWIPDEGKTLIDRDHARTGKHCLWLTGGDKTSVVLKIANDLPATSELSFWAERWTASAPLYFRIEKRERGEWREIFNGDGTVRVGRAFLSHVLVPLTGTDIKELRFTVKSPPNTGLLIDDVRIAPARPQKIESVEVVPFTLPALVGCAASPLQQLKIQTTGRLDPISLTRLEAKLGGETNRADIASVSLYRGSSHQFSAAKPVATLDKRALAAGLLHFTCAPAACPLDDGANFIWIVAEIAACANIDHCVAIACQKLNFSNGKQVQIEPDFTPQRMGVALRKGGDDGVGVFRIPGLATTNQGALIGVYDVRHRGGGDLPGDIDVGMSRSIDGGHTWQPMKIIMDMGRDPNWRYDGIGDPAVLVDRKTGMIWVAATWSHGNRSWVGSGPGLNPEETGQLILVRSDDDGVTWSKPINITKQVKRPEWCFILQGPGKGITMRDGTLVFAAQYQDPPDQRRLPHSTIIYSKDHGKTWRAGTGAFDDTTEAQVVEIEPGVLMLNCRYNRKPARVVMTTRDMGQTWRQHPTSEQALVEPGACMASLIDVDRELGKDVGGWLLFSNPDAGSPPRRRITIKASSDRGMTWPKEHSLLLDEGASAGYSCMTMIDEKTVGILYEGSQAHLTFQRIPLADILGAGANIKAADQSSAPQR